MEPDRSYATAAEFIKDHKFHMTSICLDDINMSKSCDFDKICEWSVDKFLD